MGRAQKFDHFIVSSVLACRPQFVSLLHGERCDFELDGLPRRVFDERVAAVKIECPRNLPDSKHDRSPVGPDLDLRPPPTEEVEKPRRLLVFGLHARFRQDDVRAKFLGDVIRHDFACALGLSVFECQPKLVEPMARQMKSLEHRLRDPATAIIRAKRAVLHNHHRCV